MSTTAVIATPKKPSKKRSSNFQPWYAIVSSSGQVVRTRCKFITNPTRNLSNAAKLLTRGRFHGKGPTPEAAIEAAKRASENCARASLATSGAGG